MNKNTDNFALAGFILGLVSLFFVFLAFAITSGIWLISIPTGIVGIVLSVMGLKSTNKKGMAIAGLVCSIVATSICTILALYAMCVCNTITSSTYWWR